MIKSNELRIGNYVLDNFDAHNPRQLTKISLDDFVAISHGCNSYQPVSLTEDILLKCGFGRDRGGWYLSAEYKLYNPLNPIDIPSSKYYIMTFHDKIIAVKATIYLHELQNLYFALTGEELKIKLP